MLKYESVIFDLDGVITDTARFHYIAWKKLADELGIYFDEKINESLKGVDRKTSLEIVLKNSSKFYSDEEKQRFSQRKNDYYKKLIDGMSPDDLLPGAKAALENLKTLGIKTALASASKNAFAVIDKLELGTLFDYIVDVNEVTRNKPDPEIFINAANHLNVNCAKCIGVEDAKAGIKAIKAADMFAVGIGDKSVLAEADDVICGLDQFDIFHYQV
jgi:beta-phosphoglucomutase